MHYNAINASVALLTYHGFGQQRKAKRGAAPSQDWRATDLISLVAVARSNMESLHLLDVLARALGVKSFMIGFAGMLVCCVTFASSQALVHVGTKDKLAETTQLLTVTGEIARVPVVART